MAKRNPIGKERRRVSKRDLMQMERIESLLESTKYPSSLESTQSAIIEPIVKVETPVIRQRETRYLPLKGKSIPIDNVGLTDHGYQRAISRLNLENTERNNVLKFLKSQLYRSIHIGRIFSSTGNESEMFVVNTSERTISIQLSTDFKTIITVLQYDKLAYNPAMGKIKDLVHKEYRKINRLEKARIKKLELFRREASLEMSNLELRAYKSKSANVKSTCKAKIKELETSLIESESQLLEIRNNKRQLAYGLCSVI